MILIGSRALQLRQPQAIRRRPLDFDWICTRQEADRWIEKESHKVSPTKIYELPEHNKLIVEGQTNIELEIITPGHSSELLADLVKNDKETMETPFGLVPSIHLLHSTKNSHRYKKFDKMDQYWKTAVDWHMMRACGAKIKDEHKEFRALREQEAYAGQKYPKLNVSKDKFFKDDGLQDCYIFDHDCLHEAIKLYARPAYTYYLADREQVKTSKKKFFECSEDIRLAGVLEEALTLGLERSLIVHRGTWPPDYAFRYALAKAMSTITSGFFREWGYSHLFDVIKLYEQTSKNYFDKFLAGVKNGTVKYMPGREKDFIA